jgi:outer membrane protein TolC
MTHDITSEFRARLEWQVESALRRESRFADPVGRPVSRLRAALALIAAFAIGGIAVAASDGWQDARQRDALTETAKSEEALVRLRIQLAEAEYQDVMKRFETGMADRITVADAERQLRAMKAALKRILLDMEEIRATSSTPRNDLQAPVVGQRDFVRERLALDLEAAQQALVAAEQALVEAQKRVDVGIAPPTVRLQAEAELAESQARMQQLRALLELRQRAVSGEIKAEEVALAARRMELLLQRDVLEREVQLARRRVEDLRRLVELGQTSQLELKRAEVDLLEREAGLEQTRRLLEMIPPKKE